jgi:ribosome biogenesis GTPase
LSVLGAQGEARVHPGAALYEEAGIGGPAVGDWVAVRGELAVAVLTRTSAFVRTSAGRTSAAQVVAANLDTVLVVDSLAGEARLRRVER